MKLRIKEYREEFGLTQGELAEKIGNVQRNISNWENGKSEPDCESIVKLAQFFEISIDELFFGEKTLPTTLTALETAVLKSIKNLTEQQKYALVQFLKEMA